ncbi:putative HTH-type transcriptional regulator YvdT [compost metagenome]
MAARTPDASQRIAYHHGNLREALIAAAVEIIEEQGVEGLSVREAAKRAGVSPGAPFRHFASRTALLTAVAEQATQRLRVDVDAALSRASGGSALERFAAIGHAYLAWAAANPTHFRVISDRQRIDYDGSATMVENNQAIRGHMQSLLDEAFGQELGDARTAQAQIAARALVYGLARMAVDGHFPEWNLQGQPVGVAMSETLDFFIGTLGGLVGGKGAAKTPQRVTP